MSPQYALSVLAILELIRPDHKINDANDANDANRPSPYILWVNYHTIHGLF
jgi:hypothetical protein